MSWCAHVMPQMAPCSVLHHAWYVHAQPAVVLAFQRLAQLRLATMLASGGHCHASHHLALPSHHMLATTSPCQATRSLLMLAIACLRSARVPHEPVGPGQHPPHNGVLLEP
jgi:hypothetical protein